MSRLALIPFLALLSAAATPAAAQQAEPTFCTARINDRDVVMGYDKAEARLSDTYSRREQLATRIENPGRDSAELLARLWSLPAPPEQRERALDGLVKDGLASRRDNTASLPD